MSELLHHTPADTRTPRARRRPGEIRRLLLASAREVFEEKGYARATTREITVRAGVAETLLFRNFGSKANLFAESVLLPLADFFRDWVRRFTNMDPNRDVEGTQYLFNQTLYEMASANRGLLLTFFATAVFEPEVLSAQDAIATISASLDELAAATETELIRLGVDREGYDVVTSSRGAVGTILAMALFDSVLMPSGDQTRTKQQVLQELTRQMLYGGLNQRPTLGAVNGAGVRPAPIPGPASSTAPAPSPARAAAKATKSASPARKRAAKKGTRPAT